ncbi:MAG: hypothetical protein AAGC45_04125 [Bacteroidota bacterium]
MKAITYMIAVLTLSLSSCSSQKKMVAQPPFEMGEVTCQAWAGGRAESGSGLLLEIPVLSENLDGMKLQQAFFRGKITDIRMENTGNGWVAKANFKQQNTQKPDMVMHSDSKQEVGNQPPMTKEKFPFELEANECVLSFLDGDTVNYYKVENIKEKKPKMLK